MNFFKKKEITKTFTVEKCQSCNKESKRKFSKGDFLFKEMNTCKFCDGKNLIVKIFGETIQI